MQAFFELAANRHGLADRLHGGGQKRFGSGEFLKGKAWNFGDDIINGRLKTGRRDAGNVIHQFIKRITDSQLGGDFGNREAGRFRCQSRRTRHTRVHLNNDQPPVFRIDGKLHIGAARLNTDFAQDGNRGVAHDLIFAVGQRQGRCDSDAVACMHAHRVDIFNRTDNDAIIGAVAHHFHLIFFPAEHAFFDQNFGDRRGVQTAFNNGDEFFPIISNTAAGAAHGKARSDNRWQADKLQGFKRFFQCVGDTRARAFQADFIHCLAK